MVVVTDLCSLLFAWISNGVFDRSQAAFSTIWKTNEGPGHGSTRNRDTRISGRTVELFWAFGREGMGTVAPGYEH